MEYSYSLFKVITLLYTGMWFGQIFQLGLPQVYTHGPTVLFYPNVKSVLVAWAQ